MKTVSERVSGLEKRLAELSIREKELSSRIKASIAKQTVATELAFAARHSSMRPEERHELLCAVIYAFDNSDSWWNAAFDGETTLAQWCARVLDGYGTARRVGLINEDAPGA